MDYLDHYANYICPEIYGHRNVKKAILLMLASKTDDIKGQRQRIHILLEGMPGTGKSVLVDWITEHFNAIYSDSNSTRVGLTADASKGQLTGGLLAKAHNNIIVVDEIDMLQDREALREAMEKGIIHIAKGKIDEDIPAKVRVIGCLNNIENLSPALLERFDLVFKFKTPTPEESKKISEKLLQQYFRQTTNTKIEEIKKHLEAIENFTPKIEDKEYQSVDKAFKLYFDYTKRGKSGRWIASIIRIARAIAKINMRNVTSIDFLEALSLKDPKFYVWLQTLKKT